MKLIDRDLLLDEIAKSREKNPHEDSRIRANHTIEHDHIAHLVLEQPTAYDVDEVVERLEVCRKTMESPVQTECWGEECRQGDCTVCAFEKAIEIVKSGGIE